VTVTDYCFFVTAKPASSWRKQHCEMPGCADDVWAACTVGTCSTLSCFEHFDGTLAHVHEATCTRYPTRAVDNSVSTTTRSTPQQTATNLPAQEWTTASALSEK